jgi:hypothetical protein
MQSVFAMFKSYEEARAATDDLLANGIEEHALNVIVDSTAARSYLRLIRGMKPSREPDSKTAALGGRSLFGLDSLLAGERPVHTPDAGPLIAGGELATIAVKSASGEDSSLRTTLRSLDIDEITVSNYLHGIVQGSILLWAHVDDDHAATVGRVFRRWHGTDISGKG